MACANDEELDVNRSDIDRVRRWRRSMLGALGVFGAVCLTAIALPAMADAPAPANQQTVRTWCAGCHTEDSPGHFQRLSVIRKSPEGWQMTIFRMQHVHNLALPEDARNAIIKYLSDTQGLAPAESAAGRFALERRPNMPDLKLGDNLPVMCGRCHSLARVALQRRDADEWLKHMHMHVGQFPSLEYQASARDIHWWEIATTQLPAKLGAMFPFDSPEWRAWKDRPHADLSGDWLVHGHNPGGADFVGTLSVKAAGDDDYTAHYSLQTASGEPDGDFDSKVRVFTGYEWRGTSKPGAVDTHEVLALSEDGKRLTGRWFEAAHPEVGGDVVAERLTGPAAVFMVSPRALKTGSTTEVLIAGRALLGAVNFGKGTHVKLLKAGPTLIRVAVTVNAKAEPGLRSVTVGKLVGSDMAAIYDKVDRLDVRPSYGIARIGGGRVDPVTAQFEAWGFIEPRTGQAPVALGPMKVKWTVEPHNEDAVKADDVKFAGTMRQDGSFMPAVGGPNPERKFSANNAGDLNVVASLDQDGKQLRGEGHLIVTVQTWNTPPIY